MVRSLQVLTRALLQPDCSHLQIGRLLYPNWPMHKAGASHRQTLSSDVTLKIYFCNFLTLVT